jgi:Arc/MetJ-type ribon-helix-helix transcriptional regulator
MQVTLKPQYQKFIDEQVRAGRFASPEEAIEAGVARLMFDPESDDLDDETLAAIEQSEVEFERGEGIPLEQAADEIRKRYKNS